VRIRCAGWSSALLRHRQAPWCLRTLRVSGATSSRRCAAATRKRPDGTHVVDELRAFRRAELPASNLLDGARRAVARSDAIFCRNVMIYFDEARGAA
jgi:chemotaxis methyl-accepting protein methylase